MLGAFGVSGLGFRVWGVGFEGFVPEGHKLIEKQAPGGLLPEQEEDVCRLSLALAVSEKPNGSKA